MTTTTTTTSQSQQESTSSSDSSTAKATQLSGFSLANRQRIRVSYLLPYHNHTTTSSSSFHKFGVNKLLYIKNHSKATDYENRYHLVSAGRDGCIKLWNKSSSSSSSSLTTFRKQHQVEEETEKLQNSNTSTPLSPLTISLSNQSWPPTNHQQSILSSSYQCIQSCENHTDWVNDIALLSPNRMLSASSDHTIMLWNVNVDSHAEEQEEQEKNEYSCCTRLHTVRAHSDYVKCISVPRFPRTAFSTASTTLPPVFATGGFDNIVNIWDTNRFCQQSTFTQSPLSDTLISHKNSIYTLAMDGAGRMLATGSSDKFVRIFDLKSKLINGKPSIKLRGHQDNIRCLLMNRAGNRVVSASSDGTIKYWDLRFEKCLQTFYVHNDSVWSLCWNEQDNDNVDDESSCISGGRDGQVHYLNLNTFETCHLVNTVNKEPVLSLCTIPPLPSKGEKTGGASLWISTGGGSSVGGPCSSSSMFEYRDYMDRLKRLEKKRSVKSIMSSSFNYGSPLMMRRMSFTTPTLSSSGSSSSLKSTTTTATAAAAATSLLSHRKSSAASNGSSSSVAQSYPPVYSATTATTASRQHQQQSMDTTAVNISPDDPPTNSIPTSPGIIQYHILNNRRHVLALDNFDQITLWDISSGQLLKKFDQYSILATSSSTLSEKEEEIEKMKKTNTKAQSLHLLQQQEQEQPPTATKQYIKSLEELEQKELFEMTAIPNWFSIQTKLGCLEVILDVGNCFSAEVNATDAGFNDASPEEKVNMGYLLVNALFRDWFDKRLRAVFQRQEEDEENEDDDEDDDESESESEEEESDSETEKKQSEPQEPNRNKNKKKKEVENKTTSSHEARNNNSSFIMPTPLMYTLPGTTPAIIHFEKVCALYPTNNTSNVAASGGTTKQPQSKEPKQQQQQQQQQSDNDNDAVHQLLLLQLIPIKRQIKDLSGSDSDAEIIPKWIKDSLHYGGIPPPSISYMEFTSGGSSMNSVSTGSSMTSSAQKISFYLESKDDQLGSLPSTSAKLSASRLLKMFKVAEHVVTKLNLKLPSRRVFEAMKQEYLQQQQQQQQQLAQVVDNQQQQEATPSPSTTSSSSASSSVTTPATATTTSKKGTISNFLSFKSPLSGGRSSGKKTIEEPQQQHKNDTVTSSSSEEQQQQQQQEQDEPVKPHEYLEIWCNGKVLENHYNLAVANKFFRDPNSSTITLQYKRRYPVNVE